MEEHQFEPGGKWGCKANTGWIGWCELPPESPFHTDSPFYRDNGGHTDAAVLAYDAWKAERIAAEVAHSR